jgi:hypothetical protein
MAVVAGHTGKPDIYHPPTIAERPERRCLFTIAVGDKYQWMFDITIPYMRAYCERHGIDFIVVDDNYRRDEHPCFMKQFINTLWWRYDRVCYVDSDVLIMPHAPNIFEHTPADKCSAFREVSYSERPDEIARRNQMSVDYITLYAEAYNAAMRDMDYDEVSLPDNLGEYYYNAGIFVCTKETCPHVVPVGGIMQLPTSNHFDQNYFNMMIIKHNIPMFDFGYKWNRRRGAHVAESLNPLHSYFVHYLGLGQKDKLPMDIKRMVKKDYKVHFVGATRKGARKWILEKMQDYVLSYAPDNAQCDIVEEPIDEIGHINFFNPYRYYSRSKYAWDVVFFTHPEDLEHWQAALQCDVAVVMCDKYRQQLIDEGMDESRIYRIDFGIAECFQDHRLRILNAGWMARNDKYMARKGWDEWKCLSECDWLHCVRSEGMLTQEQLITEYKMADAIVSTATLEGGPMACLEALAMGKPYIGREGVGLHDEHRKEIIRYRDYDHLVMILDRMYQVKHERAKAVMANQWPLCAQQVWSAIGAAVGDVLVCGTPKPVAEVNEPEQVEQVNSEERPARRRIGLHR